MKEYDIVIIGGGPAGMAAACAADREGASVALIERDMILGGILNQCAHRGFGVTYFGEELTGQEYAERWREFTSRTDVDILTDTMVMDIDNNRVITVSGSATRYDRIRATAVIIATGCRERPIGALPVVGSRPSGVFTAGEAQKMLNVGHYDIGKRFVILGSGDIGLIVARELALRNKEVVAVIEKNFHCGGLPRNRINCLEKYEIPLITGTTISEVHGMPRVEGVTIRSNFGEERYIQCDALITSVGLIPERELLETVNAESQPEWLFICGNADFVHDLVDDVTIESEQMGKRAALFALHGASAADADGQRHSSAVQPMPESGEKSFVCLGCPKSCVVSQRDGVWYGISCKRKEPVL